MSKREKAKTAEEAAQIVEQGKAETQALEVQQPAGALVAYDLPEEDFGTGHEGRRKEDNVVPMLNILQSKSPQVEEAQKARDLSVCAGMLRNTLTGQIYDPTKQKIELAIGFYRTTINEWIPRTSGGGFVGERPADDPEYKMASQKIRVEKKKLVPRVPIENGNELVETLTMFGAIRVDGGDPEPIAVPCWSTKLKHARVITQALQNFRLKSGTQPVNPAYFAIGVATAEEKRGNDTSYNFRFAPARTEGIGPVVDHATGKVVQGQTREPLRASFLPPGDPLMELAKAIGSAVRAGTMRADNEGMAKTGEAPGGAADDADIPF